MVLVKFILNILFVKELITESYIVFLFEFLSLLISGCCLATIYRNTTSLLIPIHVIILKYLVSSAKETYLLTCASSNVNYDMKFNCLIFTAF